MSHRVKIQHISILDCFKWVFDDRSWRRNLVMGSLWNLATLLIVPIPVLAGYGVRVTRTTAKDPTAPPPSWDGIGELYRDGLRELSVMLVHYVPFGLLIFSVLRVTGYRFRLPAEGEFLEGLWAMLTVALVTWLISLLGFYVLTGILRMTVSGRWTDAFQPRAIAAMIRRNYANYMLLVVVLIVTSTVSQLGVCLCCVGILPATFWMEVCICRAWGLIAAYDPEPIL